MESALATGDNGTSNGLASSGLNSFGYSILIIAAIIWIILSFTQKRTHAWPDCCWGLPGTASAVNFLNPQHRIIYTLAFVAFTSQFFNLMVWLIEDSIFSSLVGNRYVSVIVHVFMSFALSLVTALQCYPLFACVEAPIRLVGYILGSLYSDIYAVYLIYSIVFAIQHDSGYNYGIAAAVILFPQLVCLVIVLIWYHAQAVTESIHVYTLGTDALYFRTDQSLHEHYVRSLLSGWKGSRKTDRKLGFDKAFHFPFPFLIVIAIVTLMIFQLTMQVIITSMSFLSKAASEAPDQASLYHKMSAVMVLMPLAAASLIYFLFFHLVYGMRKRMMALWSGKEKCDINFHHIDHPSLTLASALRYAGVQIASVILAWIVFTVFFVLVGLLFVLLSEYPSELGFFIYFVIMLILWTAGVMGAQLLIVKFFFIHEESHSVHTIIIHNRRAFSCFAYVVLLYNVAVGLMFSLFRLMVSCFITTTMLLRMDKSLMIGGFEVADFGLRFYRSFVTVEALLGNPVASTFVHILKRRSCDDISQPTTNQGWSHDCNAYGAVSRKPKERYSRRALNRWMVAYTLINNKSLVSLRARNIPVSNTTAMQVDYDNFSEESPLCGVSSTGSGSFVTSQEQYNPYLPVPL